MKPFVYITTHDYDESFKDLMESHEDEYSTDMIYDELNGKCYEHITLRAQVYQGVFEDDPTISAVFTWDS